MLVLVHVGDTFKLNNSTLELGLPLNIHKVRRLGRNARAHFASSTSSHFHRHGRRRRRVGQRHAHPSRPVNAPRVSRARHGIWSACAVSGACAARLVHAPRSFDFVCGLARKRAGGRKRWRGSAHQCSIKYKYIFYTQVLARSKLE